MPLHCRTRSSESELSRGRVRGTSSWQEQFDEGGFTRSCRPVRRDITHPGSGPPASSQGPSSGHTRPDISSPLFVELREETTPRPFTPVIQPGTQPGIQGTGSGNKRRFRLPTGLPRSPHPRTSGLTLRKQKTSSSRRASQATVMMS